MKIVNIVASGSLNQKIDLRSLSIIGDSYSYNPSYYIGGYVKLRDAKVTIYQSGKYIITGIKNTDAIQICWKELANHLSATSLNSDFFEKPKIRNIVAVANFGHPINIVKLISQLNTANENAEYEPEVFPGLIWKKELGVANIFQSGKTILLGCKSVNELNTLWKTLTTQLERMENGC